MPRFIQPHLVAPEFSGDTTGVILTLDAQVGGSWYPAVMVKWNAVDDEEWAFHTQFFKGFPGSPTWRTRFAASGDVPTAEMNWQQHAMTQVPSWGAVGATVAQAASWTQAAHTMRRSPALGGADADGQPFGIQLTWSQTNGVVTGVSCYKNAAGTISLGNNVSLQSMVQSITTSWVVNVMQP